jgi:hypothetical protein
MCEKKKRVFAVSSVMKPVYSVNPRRKQPDQAGIAPSTFLEYGNALQVEG